MSMTTPPWAPDPMGPRDLLRVPRRWPHTTVLVAVTTVLYLGLCWTEAAR
jgi:hypothetical protein